MLVDLIRDLKIAMPIKIVTVAISIAPRDIDISLLSVYADYINIMAYDIEGWEGYAGYNAPLYYNKKMPTNQSIDYFIRNIFDKAGINKSKLVL